MFDPIVGVRNVRRRAMRQLPRLMRRRRRSNPAMVAVPGAAAGLAVVAGLLLWDERRRSAMRRRLQEVAGSVSGSVNQVKPASPVGAPRD